MYRIDSIGNVVKNSVFYFLKITYIILFKHSVYGASVFRNSIVFKSFFPERKMNFFVDRLNRHGYNCNRNWLEKFFWF
jgi:hypothetical protein